MKKLTYDVSAVAHVFGLGYSFVEIHERSIDMNLRLWVLATPVDGTLIDLVLVGQVRELNKPKRPIVGMRFLPPRLRTRLMNEIILSTQTAGRHAGCGRSGVENDIGHARDCVGPTARLGCIGDTATSSIRIARAGVRMARWSSWQPEHEVGRTCRTLSGRSRRVEGRLRNEDAAVGRGARDDARVRGLRRVPRREGPRHRPGDGPSRPRLDGPARQPDHDPAQPAGARRAGASFESAPSRWTATATRA